MGKAARATSPEFKGAGHRVICVEPAEYGDDYRPNATGLLETFDVIEKLVGNGAALAISTPGYGGEAEALFKMCVGNQLGVALVEDVPADSLFDPAYGSFLVELADDAEPPASTDNVSVELLGTTTETYEFVAAGETCDLTTLQEAWESGIEGVFPYRTKVETEKVDAIDYQAKDVHVFSGAKLGRPRVTIPVFPGNNCEYDSARAFTAAGADADVFVINNLTPAAVAESTHELAERIRKSQIVMIPGGFSGGDEPDGSAKFITAFFRAPEVTEAVRDLLQARDGLMLGICNGFQALIKLGLVPYGEIRDLSENSPTLTHNTIGRHASCMVNTRVISNLSPWFNNVKVGDVHTIAISHGEGRFVADAETVKRLQENGQIATQYVDAAGNPSLDIPFNPNGSVDAIEGITSPDGRVLGKMGHSERIGEDVAKNVPGSKDKQLFEAGVRYYK